jgi:hypothetical protein
MLGLSDVGEEAAGRIGAGLKAAMGFFAGPRGGETEPFRVDAAEHGRRRNAARADEVMEHLARDAVALEEIVLSEPFGGPRPALPLFLDCHARPPLL